MRTLIVGTGRLGRTLCQDLVRAGHDARLLDASDGSPLRREVLAEEASGCDALAAVTDDDALNAVVALAARRELRVPMAIAVIANRARAEALAGSGIRVVCPTARTAHELQLVLLGTGVQSELELAGETAVYRVDLPARLSGRRLAELERRGELLPVAVERDGRVLLATPDLELREGDVLHVAASHLALVTDLTHP